MSKYSGIPVVQRENDISKTFKMVIVTGCIIVIIVCFLYYQDTDIYIPHIDNTFKAIKSHKPYDITKPVIGKFIQLININKKILPVDKIVVVDNNNSIFPLLTKNAKYTDINKKGSMIQYELSEPIHINQLIIDLNMFDARRGNITTTQVRIRDAEYDIVWSNNDPLSVERYNDVYMEKKNIIYPTQQQILDPNLSTNDHEATLGYNLMKNTW